MAKDTLKSQPVKLNTVGGMDESVELTDASPILQEASGVYPFFYASAQRIFGKKIIDYNPVQKIWGIHQSFNGVCLYGYYVETSAKLYFHICSAPPDLRIRFSPIP